MIDAAAAVLAPPAPSVVRPRPAGLLRGALRVAAFDLKRSARSFRAFVLLLFGALPAVLVGMRDVLFDVPDEEFRAGAVFFHFVFFMATMQFFLLFCSVFLGASAFSEEVEDQTLVYLFTRPLRRASVFLGKLWSATVLGSAILTVTTLAMWAMRGGRFGAGSAENVPATAAQALQCCGLLTLGCAAYSAVFAAIGTFLKKPLLVGILVAFGWEVVVSNIPGVIPNVTVMYYLRSIFASIYGRADLPRPVVQVFLRGPNFDTAGDAILVVAGVAVVGAAIGAWIVSHREYVLNRAE